MVVHLLAALLLFAAQDGNTASGGTSAPTGGAVTPQAAPPKSGGGAAAAGGPRRQPTLRPSKPTSPPQTPEPPAEPVCPAGQAIEACVLDQVKEPCADGPCIAALRGGLGPLKSQLTKKAAPPTEEADRSGWRIQHLAATCLAGDGTWACYELSQSKSPPASSLQPADKPADASEGGNDGDDLAAAQKATAAAELRLTRTESAVVLALGLLVIVFALQLLLALGILPRRSRGVATGAVAGGPPPTTVGATPEPVVNPIDEKLKTSDDSGGGSGALVQTDRPAETSAGSSAGTLEMAATQKKQKSASSRVLEAALAEADHLAELNQADRLVLRNFAIVQMLHRALDYDKLPNEADCQQLDEVFRSFSPGYSLFWYPIENPLNRDWYVRENNPEAIGAAALARVEAPGLQYDDRPIIPAKILITYDPAGR